jgi:hypothetical protein
MLIRPHCSQFPPKFHRQLFGITLSKKLLEARAAQLDHWLRDLVARERGGNLPAAVRGRLAVFLQASAFGGARRFRKCFLPLTVFGTQLTSARVRLFRLAPPTLSLPPSLPSGFAAGIVRRTALLVGASAARPLCARASEHR